MARPTHKKDCNSEKSLASCKISQEYMKDN